MNPAHYSPQIPFVDKVVHRLVPFPELEAYANVVGVFRAQGTLDQKRLKILSDLREVLQVDANRHRCEVRRATNDEILTTIADR